MRSTRCSATTSMATASAILHDIPGPVTFHNKGLRGAMPLRIHITPLPGGLYQIEVADTLSPGQYALTPDGTKEVFCFEVF